MAEVKDVSETKRMVVKIEHEETESVFQFVFDKRNQIGDAGGPNNCFHVDLRVRYTEGNVARNRIVAEKYALGHVTEVPLPAGQIGLA